MTPMLMPALLMATLLLGGCSREAEDWRSAQTADTPEAYAVFLRQHADSAQAATATTRMEQLAEERDWQLAASEASSQAYQNFIAQHPDGKWAPEARIRVENFNLNQSIGMATAAPAADSVVKAPAVQPPVAQVASNGFGVQLGAYSSEAGAQSQWRVLAARFPRELGGQTHRVASSRAGGAAVYRLQVARASEQQARELCSRLTARGQGCVVVLPR